VADSSQRFKPSLADLRDKPAAAANPMLAFRIALAPKPLVSLAAKMRNNRLSVP
jgi:hypothetical protein